MFLIKRLAVSAIALLSMTVAIANPVDDTLDLNLPNGHWIFFSYFASGIFTSNNCTPVAFLQADYLNTLAICKTDNKAKVSYESIGYLGNLQTKYACEAHIFVTCNDTSGCKIAKIQLIDDKLPGFKGCDLRNTNDFSQNHLVVARFGKK